MKAFVTGGTGFIGSRIVQKLILRGDEVTALVHSQKSAFMMESMGAKPVWGDVTAIESMRKGMQGNDVVFHVAGWYNLGSSDVQDAELINVEGTRNVIEMAYQLKIPKVVYTSSVAANGDTHGFVADESYLPPEGPFLTEYDRTKWKAHYQVAIPMIEKGAPVVIVMPGVVFGPGDHSLIGEFLKYFYMGFFPVLPGPELTVTFVYVDDIAEGHILAAEKGEPGESYFLTGPALSLGEIVEIWADVIGRRPPIAHIPGRFIKPLAPLVAFVNSFVPLPAVISKDAVSILDATYLARSDKAQRELGWQPRPVIEGLNETFEYISQSYRPIGVELTPIQRRQIASVALGAAAGLLLAWILNQRQRR